MSSFLIPSCWAGSDMILGLSPTNLCSPLGFSLASLFGVKVAAGKGAMIITGSPVTWFLAVTSMLKPERFAWSLMMVR